MKLLTRTTILYVIITSVVFTFGGVLFYNFLSNLVSEEATEGLYTKKEIIVAALDKDSIVQNSSLAVDVSILETAGGFQEHLYDTSQMNALADEFIPYRVLEFPYEKSGRHYSVALKTAVLESDDLIEGIFSSFILVLILVAVITIVSMQLASRRIWKPFLSILNEMRDYKPGSTLSISLPSTRIMEFMQLNGAIEKMTSNTNTAFHSLKSFTENAAHEIQTPLAVIQSTTEVLLQDENLSEEQHRTISHLSSTTARLSNIVSTLLLMTRIENKQFQQHDSIDVSSLISSKIDLFKELFEQRGIKLVVKTDAEVHVKLHRVLAEILVSNLLVNAVRHTPENGSTNVTLTKSEFVVKNSGSPLKGDSSRIFDRFYKEDQSEQSTGLGLSLVKMVADTSGYTVTYKYGDGEHAFSVIF